MAEKSLEHIAASHEIQGLKARYCRLIDSRNWDGLKGLFAPNARFEGFTIIPAAASGEEFVTELSKSLSEAVTVHHCHMPEIKLRTANEARGIWAMMDFVEWSGRRSLAHWPDVTGFVGYGFYEESYLRHEGVWKIALMRLTRTRVDPLIGGERAQTYNPFNGLEPFIKPSLDWLST